MTDTLQMHSSRTAGSVPSSPVLSHKQIHLTQKGSDGVPSTEQQSLEDLREQLMAAKIPVSKRASVCELPQSASDCQLVSGTTRCSLPLCEDSCTTAHRHHRTHAKPLAPDAPLVYSRPSISLAASNPTPAESPADSRPTSANTSPQQQYRRASFFGFGLGSHRGSVAMSTHDLMSGPPSPMSGDSSALSSAANSPREKHTTSAAPSGEYIVPIREEATAPAPAPVASAAAAAPSIAPAMASSSSSSSFASAGAMAPYLAALDRQYWKLRNHIVNLADYRPSAASGVVAGSAEALTRTDLAAAPREDFMDQNDCSWDPRSPQPPSPVEVDPEQIGQLTQVNINESDKSKAPIEYVIQPQQH